MKNIDTFLSGIVLKGLISFFLKIWMILLLCLKFDLEIVQEMRETEETISVDEEEQEID